MITPALVISALMVKANKKNKTEIGPFSCFKHKGDLKQREKFNAFKFAIVYLDNDKIIQVNILRQYNLM